ncbi:MAG: hypothetical protein LAO79_01040 [Acidobacteriia bacterium]|nr:hypothetical protein [Terriglobia bacterium]
MPLHTSCDTAPPRFSIPVGLVTAQRDERDELRRLLAHTAWDLNVYTSGADALSAYRRAPNPILLWDLRADPRSWRDVIQSVRLARRDECVIFLAESNAPIDQMLREGAFDVLTRPFARADILLTLLFAYSYCRAHWPRTSPRREFHPVVCGKVRVGGRKNSAGGGFDRP